MSVSIAWNANPEPDVSGYRVHYGTSSGDYPYFIDVGANTEATLRDLAAGGEYYLALTAYDVDNLESDYSEEAVIRIPTDAGTGRTHGLVRIEGEDGAADEPVIVGSGGDEGWIGTPEGAAGGSVTWTFGVVHPGRYRVDLRARAAADAAVTVRLDGETLGEAGFSTGDGTSMNPETWNWARLTNAGGGDLVLELEPGSHQLVFEDFPEGLAIDRLALGSASDFAASDALAVDGSHLEILENPEDRTVSEGSPVTFRASAVASGPVAYQWFHDGSPIPQADGANLVIPEVSAADAGSYTVTVSGDSGSATSTAAALRVLPPSPIRVLSTSRDGDGGMRFDLAGEVGDLVRVLTSTDLDRWETLAEVPPTGSIKVPAAADASEARRFFKLESVVFEDK